VTRAQERVDAREELSRLAEEREGDASPDLFARDGYWQRMVLMTTPEAQTDEDGALSYSTETPP
jgi:hypothetical protein